jgi:hypothetical protein
VLGNILISLIVAVLTFGWLLAFRVPYPPHVTSWLPIAPALNDSACSRFAACGR